MVPDLRGIPVTVMGLGRFGGGLAAAQFLSNRGADVSVTDLRTESELSDSLKALDGCRIQRFAFGEHPPELFRECRMLVVNPAVKPGNPLVLQAISEGVDVTTEIDLFLRWQRGRVISVTGSNGKSTTTALIHALLNGSGLPGRNWLGGNIGCSLLPELEQIDANDRVVLELSSFQLESLRRRGFHPEIGVVTNLTPNHLDWHGTLEAYHSAKQSLFDRQARTETAVLPADDDRWRTRGRRLVFGTLDTGEDGVFLESGSLILREDHGLTEDAVRVNVPGRLPGHHNRLNIAAASAAAWRCGADPHTFSDSLSHFQPLPHRLQCVADRFGRQFWNDSIATTPESASPAVQLFSGKCVVLAGGYDKGQDLAEFAETLYQHARAVVLMGQTATTLDSQLQSLSERSPGGCSQRVVCSTFAEAFAAAVAFSEPGDIVLLSPGCASYGWFQDYRERGDLFEHYAREWKPS